MRTIPKRNYLFVFLILIGTCLTLWYLVSYYNAKKEYDLDNNKMMNIVTEINESELQSYILDNHQIILYLSSSRDNQYQQFEKDLKKFIKKNELTKTIVYLDTSKVNSNFYSDFVNNYFNGTLQNKNLNMIPNMIVIVDGKVSKLLYDQKIEPKIDDVKKFIDQMESW